MSENWREKSGENVRRREKTKSQEWGDIDEKVILWLFFNLRDDKMGERDLVPSVLLLRERTLVAACHVAPTI